MSFNDIDPNPKWYLFNNLFYGGSLSCYAGSASTNLLAYDNLFDRTTISSTAWTYNYNGYVTGQNRLSPNGATDVILTNAPIYQTGALGRFYYPTDGGLLSRLIDAGSSPADDVGLYHYTTMTNQVKETNSVVDIGHHYVAVNASGIPFDTDGDGIQDHLDPDITPRTDIVWSNGVWHWKPYSLAWNCWTNAMACTNGAQGNFPNMFTALSTPNERNTNFWLRRFTGWPAYSVWNNCNTNLWPNNTSQTCEPNATTYQKAGILVSPEHVLTAGHMKFPTNTWLAFMDMSNNVVFRQVKDYFYKSAYGGEPTNNLSTNMPSAKFADYYIGLLDTPVPANIGYVKVIPTNWWAWFDAPFDNNATDHPYHVPLYIQNCQHRTPVMKDLVSLTCLGGYLYKSFDLLTLTNWNHAMGIGGDSGSPRFFTLDGELCLADITASSLIFGSGYEVTASSGYVHACVNATMRELSLRNGRTNIYSLTVKDLSKYPIYRPSYNCSP